jgi:hypothetical protein
MPPDLASQAIRPLQLRSYIVPELKDGCRCCRGDSYSEVVNVSDGDAGRIVSFVNENFRVIGLTFGKSEAI